MTRRAVIVLGVGQCVNWGVLFYSFAVLVLPLQQELAVPAWVITGAFSLALLVSGALAPAVGRWADRGRAPLLMQIGGVSAALLLAGWTVLPGIVMLYVVWAALGVCMAITLYEPAFALVGRAYVDATLRLRALAAVTIFGGLASTLFLPLTAFTVSTSGWRTAVLVLAGLLLLSTAAAHALVFRQLPAAAGGPVREREPPIFEGSGVAIDRRRFMFVTIAFGLVSLTSAAFVANLVPALSERGLAPATAAMLGGLMGVMQLPGRALLLHGAFADMPLRLFAASVAFQAAGLGGVALAPRGAAVAAGAMLFALGAGLTSLVRPHLVQTMFSAARGGYLNGQVARYQHLARAAGPLGVAWLAGIASYSVVYAALAVAFVCITALALCQDRSVLTTPGCRMTSS